MAHRRSLLALALVLLCTAAHAAVIHQLVDQQLRYRLTFVAEDILRIQAAPLGQDFTDEGSGTAPIVLPQVLADIEVMRTEQDGVQTFATSALELRAQGEPLRLELWRRADQQLLWRELRPLRMVDSTTTQTLTGDPAEHIYGGGQQNGRFQFNGRLMEISYSGGWEEGDRPSPAPFYMSDRGYGVLRNTWADGRYDFRSDRYLTTAHQEHRFDAYCLVADGIHGVLDLYTRLTGRAALLPRWALGYGDADCYNDGDNVDKPGTVPEGWSDGATGTTIDVIESVAQKYREHEMPGSWILPNDGYGCGYEQLPEVVARLSELGFRTGLWTEDGVEKIAWEVGTAGTRVQKLDVAWTGKGYQWAMDANHDAAQGFLDNSDARPFIWTVMGWAGIQRYAVTWTGDQSGSWDYIRWHVPTLIGSALSGMNYSTGDVDGIFGGSPETFTRDLQWKCFTPVLMGMSGWSKAARKHPWWFDEPYRSINRRYLVLRQQLMPYLYTLARETAQTGAPMVRGLMWDHGDDPRAHDHPYQFLLGRDLLVAPVYRSQDAGGGWREGIYLPEGQWIDYWTGQVTEVGPEGRTLDVPVDLATMPVFVRAGAIIPMAPPSLYDDQVACDPLTLDLYPRGQSSFELYEDDGDTRAYRHGAFTTQAIRMEQDGDLVTVFLDAAQGEFDGQLTGRAVELVLHTRRPPISLRTDSGRLVNRQDGRRGWWYHEDLKYGLLRVNLGRLDMTRDHWVEIGLRPGAPATTPPYPPLPPADAAISADELMVIGRPAEEPGHRLENAFDDDPGTWFRTVRDQSVAYGPHEFVVSLGGRRLVEGLRLAPRNDKYWQYGQVKHYEVFVADVNGQWGEPVASGALEQIEDEQEIRFPAAAGRLLRFRVLGTHDDGVDPMVLGARTGEASGPYLATAPVAVGNVTLGTFKILEAPADGGSPLERPLTEVVGLTGRTVTMDELSFEHAITVVGADRVEAELGGNWHTLRAEVGLDTGQARFQVWGDEQMLWDSGLVNGPAIIKPRLDIRGQRDLSLRTLTDQDDLVSHWAEVMLDNRRGTQP